MSTATDTPEANPSTETTETPTEATPSGDDYRVKVMAGGEFAWEQNKVHQAKADRLSTEMQALKAQKEGLGEYASVDTKLIAGHMDNYVAFVQTPQGREVMRQIAEDKASGGEGKFTMPSAETKTTDDDEYLTDEQKEIRELRSEIADVRTGQGSLSVQAGQQAMTGHFTSIAAKMTLTDEQKSKAAAGLKQEIQSWGGQGAVGAQAIKNLSTAAGKDVIETLVIKHLGGWEGLKDNAKSAVLRDKDFLSGITTDSPSSALTGATEAPDIVQDTVAYLEMIERDPSLLPPE